VGGLGVGFGGWGWGGWPQTPTPQSPIPNPQSPIVINNKNIKLIKYNNYKNKIIFYSFLNFNKILLLLILKININKIVSN